MPESPLRWSQRHLNESPFLLKGPSAVLLHTPTLKDLVYEYVMVRRPWLALSCYYSSLAPDANLNLEQHWIVTEGLHSITMQTDNPESLKRYELKTDVRIYQRFDPGEVLTKALATVDREAAWKREAAAAKQRKIMADFHRCWGDYRESDSGWY
jgi:hypothetical protein